MEDELGRVTIDACVNATGIINLPPQVIGKAKRPRRYGLATYRVLWPEKISDFYCLILLFIYYQKHNHCLSSLPATRVTTLWLKQPTCIRSIYKKWELSWTSVVH